ncbi:MAG: autotransporter domain-containing protein [Microvirga sp.]
MVSHPACGNRPSLAAIGCALGLAALASPVAPAAASCTTSGSAVTCTGTTTTASGPIAEVKDNGSITNEGTASATGATSYAIFGRNGNSLTNNGSLTTQADSADAVEVLGNDNGLTNRGSVATQGTSADALRAVGDRNALTNAGTVTTGPGSSSRGFFAQGSGNRLTNTGTITTGGAGSEGMNAEGNGNTLTNGGRVVTSGAVGNGIRAHGDLNSVLNAGSIATTGLEARGIKVDFGSGSRIVNEGTITTTGERAYGVWIASTAGQTATFTNRVSGAVTTSNALVLKFDGGDERVENFGVLSAGTQAQAVDLGAGSDSFLIGSTSKITGFVDAAAGQDTFSLGGAANASFNAAAIGAAAQYRNFEHYEKVGESTWTLSGDNNDVMPWDVREGTLMVIGVMGGSGMTVMSGATLGGSGTVGGIDARSGSTLTPGVGGIGILTVTGNVIIADGTTYRIDLNPNQESDRIVAGGTADVRGGTVQVNAASGDYKPGSRWTILTATGGVTGQFSTVVTNIALFTPTLTRDGNNIYLELPKADTVVLPRGRPVIDIYLPVAPDDIDDVLDQTSGEPNVTADDVILDHDHLFRAAILCRLRCSMGGLPSFAALDGVTTAYMADLPRGKGAASHPVAPLASARRDYSLWGKAIGSWGTIRAGASTAGVERSTGGLVAGVDLGLGTDYRLGAAAGYFSSSFDIGALTSTGSVESGYVAVYGAAAFGQLTLRGGVAYGHHAVDVNRALAFAGFSGSTRSSGDADSMQAFGEAGYTVSFGRFALEPFAGLAHVRIGDRSVLEEGSEAALYGRVRSFDATLSTLGLRLIASLPTEAGLLTFKGTLGWQHVFGDTAPEATFAYVSGSTPFVIVGAPIDRDSLLAEAGVNWSVSDNVTLGVAYDGTLGARARDHTVRGSLSIRF